jgi:transposase
VQALEAELALADERLGKLVAKAAPRTMALFAIGVDHAGQLLTTVCDHPDRLRGEGAFAHLCGVAPIPASSGKTRRHRLHRGGDRAANRALHLAAVVRLRWCPRTRAYAARRAAEGLSTREIIRCVKRYLAREAYHRPQSRFRSPPHRHLTIYTSILGLNPGRFTAARRGGHPPPAGPTQPARRPALPPAGNS